MPLTGPVATFGVPEEAAIQLAVDTINGKGGLLGGRKLQLVTADTMGTASGAVAGWQRLVAQSPVAVVGPILTGEVAALVQSANQAGIPLLEGSQTQELAAGEQGSNWFFRTTETVQTQAAAEVTYAMTHLHPSRPALILENDELGQSLAPALVSDFQSYGVKVVAQQYASDTAVDLTAQIEAVKAAHPDMVIFTDYAPVSALYLKQADQLNLNVPVYTFTSMLDALYYFDLASLVLFPAHSVIADAAFPTGDQVDKGAAAFVAAYHKKTGKDPNDLSSGWYTAVFMLAAAIERAGTTSPAALAKALRATANFNSFDGISMPTPPLACDAHQNCDSSTLLIGVQNNALSVLQATS
jgi:branched-chain amino acid transport system substrate-binding protein